LVATAMFAFGIVTALAVYFTRWGK
jgi:hypothetical protein